jgi:hypothetical protein
MLNHDAARLALDRLFARRPVADLPQLCRTLGTQSRMSVFRRLSVINYLSSYTHTGRYYTLQSIPQFDTDGLWRFEGVGFSRDGTLKATVRRLVDCSEAGRTQRELQLRLGIRAHNPLLDLVEAKQLRREIVQGEYLYVAAARKHATEQLGRRNALPAVSAAPALDVEVLLEVIHGARLPPPDASAIVARLAARGIRADIMDVAAVLNRHGLKKTPPSRSTLLPR